MIWFAAALAAPGLDSGGGTAYTLGDANGKATLGLFRPWTFKATPKTDLITTGWGTFLSPRLDIKQQVKAGDDGAVAIVGGLNMPTLALRVGRGWIFNESDRIPFAIQGKVGVLATAQVNDGLRVTGGAMVRFGVPFGGSDMTPRDFYFIDWGLAPLVDGPVTGVLSAQMDAVLHPNWHVSVTLSTQLTKSGPEFVGRGFLLWGFTKSTALGIGMFTHHDDRPLGYEHYWLPAGDFQLRF